jgi:hypothetical protein
MTTRDATWTQGRPRDGWVAQLAEQWTENPRVGGSIPPPAILLMGGEVDRAFISHSYSSSLHQIIVSDGHALPQARAFATDESNPYTTKFKQRERFAEFMTAVRNVFPNVVVVGKAGVNSARPEQLQVVSPGSSK